jgi:ABC-type transporter Mla subunit MlaD
LNWPLIVAILVVSTAPLYAQRQQQSVAKLKADARNLVGIIGSDKTKTQTYCQIDDLSEQLDQAIEKKDNKKAKTLAGKITELNKKMGPEFSRSSALWATLSNRPRPRLTGLHSMPSWQSAGTPAN